MSGHEGIPTESLGFLRGVGCCVGFWRAKVETCHDSDVVFLRGRPQFLVMLQRVRNFMSVQDLRLERGWSQEQLAQMSGLSVRTIQRIERGETAGMESLKCLAAVFETDVCNLKGNSKMTKNGNGSSLFKERAEREALEYVDNLRGFWMNLLAFVVIIPMLYALNVYVTPDAGFWVIYVIAGWAVGILLHGLITFGLFNLFGPRWEKRQFEKRRNR